MNWSAIGESGNFDCASRLWAASSSAGGVNGIDVLDADIVARSGSSTSARFSFIGELLFVTRDNSGEVAREERCEVLRERVLFR